ncbi:shikimate dehydrogenase [Novosphingobium sp. KACC 22771]|uniref:shikimate dehydrogenase n=1 Tax=Novosphingobium sp. KACC 22771 TaxID=3025670 RepID=UPI0023666F2E|nr:shikimate dehydrogenase [Novosphingobium sp. KACC 22771]WDF74061.1 shikimate dehydrogenase [Novosphingobium sp. KACC 22771]
MTAPTRPFAEVIGDPIAQSKSPAIHGHWLERLGLEADYGRAHVLPGDLPAYMAARRAEPLWRGCNVTMPHKETIIPLLDGLDPLASRIGAVNTVAVAADGRLIGFNTDAPGFIEPLLPVLRDELAPENALVMGAGGAARAIVVALADAGMAITLAARDAGKAQELLDELAPATPYGPRHRAAVMDDFADGGDGEFGMIVNASPLGMVGNPPLALDLRHGRPAAIVYDIVTAPLETPLLAAARAEGMRCIDGLSMLIGQAGIAFEHFFGADPARERGDLTLRAILTA